MGWYISIPNFILVALYLLIGMMVSTSFTKDKEEPDYGFVTIVMLFWPVIVAVFFVLAMKVLLEMLRGK